MHLSYILEHAIHCLSLTVYPLAPVHVEPAPRRREAMGKSRGRRRIGVKFCPGHGDGVVDVQIVGGTCITSAATVHVELPVRRSEAVAVSRCRRDASCWCREIRPDLRDWIKRVKVIEKARVELAVHEIQFVIAPMHVEHAVCRAEAVEHSGRRGDAMDLLGEVRPGRGDEVVDVKAAEGART